MDTDRETGETISNDQPFKIVGLIGSIVAVMACFVGAVLWVSVNMADNSMAIKSLQTGQVRHENLISSNTKIIHQHAQLLVILDQHASSIKILTDFMTQGGRFTKSDGHKLREEMQGVRDRLQHYQVLEAELKWIKKSIIDLERDIRDRFDKLDEKIDESKIDKN